MRDPRAPLDDAINEVARTLTARQPPDTLREAVRTRLTAGSHGRNLGWTPGSRVWQAGVAIAAVLVTVWIGRGWLPVTSTQPAPVASAPEVSPVPPAAEPIRGGVPDDTRSVQVVRSRPRRVTGDAVPPLTITPIVIEPLMEDSLSRDSDIQVMAVDIEPLRVEPLDAP